MQSNPERQTPTGNSLPLPKMIAIGCGLLALVTSLWGLVNHNRMTSLEAEVTTLRDDIAILRENATASVYPFTATEIAPPDLQGVVYIGISGSGAVIISNLPPAGDNEVYQMWLLGETDDNAVAAGTLWTNPQGQGFALIPADSSGYARIAVSLEPQGSDEPSGAFLLIASVNEARGVYPGPVVVCQNLFE